MGYCTVLQYYYCYVLTVFPTTHTHQPNTHTHTQHNTGARTHTKLSCVGSRLAGSKLQAVECSEKNRIECIY